MKTIPVALLLFAALSLSGCSPSSDPPPETLESAGFSFTDVSSEAGLASFSHKNASGGEYWFPETMGAGGGLIDIDSDGLLDIVVVEGGGWDDTDAAPIRIYRNLGDARFERAQEAEPSGLTAYGMGIVAADYDNDGDQDVFYTTLGRDALLRNDGGRLVDVSSEAGIPNEVSWSSAATFLDADRDGWLDLYIGRYVSWSPDTDLYCSQDGENKGYCTPELYQELKGSFLHNRGDGTFEDRTVAAGLGTPRGKTLGALVMDHNRDGWPDLMLANDTEPDELYLNQGDGTFKDIGVISGIAFDERGRARAGMGVASGVVDQSGEETLFVGNFSSEMVGVYRHLGNDVFLDRAASSRVGQPSLLTLSFGLLLADLDVDGDLDLFVGNGHVQPHIETVKENIRFRQAPHLFSNTGDGTFVDRADGSGVDFGNGWLARAVAWGDVDQDGDPDLLVTENGAGVHLLRNDAQDVHSVQVVLEGATSNRGAIGAAVELWIDGRAQYRLVRAGGSYLAQSQMMPLFGLGASTSADSVVVRWPSGQVSREGPVSAGVLTIRED